MRVLGTELRSLRSNGKIPGIPTHASVHTPHVSLAHRSTGSPTALFTDLAASHRQRAPGAGKNARAPCVLGRARGRGELETHARPRGGAFPAGRGVTFSVRGGAWPPCLIPTSLYRDPHAHGAARVPHRASR